MDDVFYASPWPGLLLWSALYISDFLLTMICARLYRGVREHVKFEGSYEITPYYQKDVDELRVFSPRFFLALALTCTIQALIWWLAVRAVVLPDLYLFALGAMVLLELTIHVRHIRNLFLFRAILAGTGISGRIEYPRDVVLRLSAVELFSFAVLYAIVFLVTVSWFVLGGAVACVSTGANHLNLVRRHQSGHAPG